MQNLELAKTIFALRHTNPRSQVILAAAPEATRSSQPRGVLLLKPSSGLLPLETIEEILKRLTEGHRYLIRSALWWRGEDLRAAGLMALHYPGFHRVANGGWAALSEQARAAMKRCYAPTEHGDAFKSVFGMPFGFEMVRTPYELVQAGLSPEQLNRLWEQDRSKEPQAVQRLHRLDEDSLCVALVPCPPAQQDRPVVLLNGFYTKLQQDFEARGCIALWIEQGTDSATSWEALRSDYAGKTNPFQASPNTIRGDAARGILKVETVSILANVIHLSANEAEGRREVDEVWWHPERLAVAAAAMAA